MKRRGTQLTLSAQLLLCLAWLVAARTAAAQTPDPQNAAAGSANTAVQKAIKQSYPLDSSTNVQGNVSVEAVLIPPKISKAVFGKTVGKNYAVIGLTITNHSTTASLIVNSIFIDYSNWLLSGLESQSVRSQADTGQAGNGQGNGSSAANSNPGEEQLPPPDQSGTRPNQVASVESRIVRGQLLDAQPWTFRNWVVRALQAGGSIASAYSFTFVGMRTIQGVSAFNGQVVPAAQNFWPDATVGQMNRISDVGFQVNKTIPKQASDIVVAFYPIERFLTPGLQKIFMKSPAVFFTPYAMIVDPDMKKKITPILSNFMDVEVLNPKNLSQIIAGGCKPPVQDTLKDACLANHALLKASLNNVRVVVGGTMNVDVNNVPAIINSVEPDIPSGGTATSIWSATGTVSGSIHGNFLSGGQPSIAEASDLQITNVVAVADGSTDTVLHFKMTLGKAVPGGQKLTFKVTKKNSQGATIDSPNFVYTVPSLAPAITSANSAIFTVGANGSFTVTATGTPAPTFSEAGALPGGVTLATNGTLSGTPADGTAARYPITITAANGAQPDTHQTFTLTVNQAAAAHAAPAITSASSTTFTIDTKGSFTVTASGSPAPTFSETGTLPGGVTLAANGTLSGTPAAGTANKYTITITATNGVQPDAHQTFTLTVK